MSVRPFFMELFPWFSVRFGGSYFVIPSVVFHFTWLDVVEVVRHRINKIQARQPGTKFGSSAFRAVIGIYVIVVVAAVVIGVECLF